MPKLRAMRIAAFLLLTLLGTLLDAPASAQDSNRLVAYLGLGAGGEVTIDPDGIDSFDVDLDASVGLGVRYEILLSDLLSIAPFFEWLTYEPDDTFTDREHFLDAGVFLKFRGKIRAGSTDLELYGGIPFAFAIATVDDTAADDDALLGFNIGVLGGIAAFFGKFGVFFEVGWRGHQLWRNDIRYGANQAAINIGGAIRL